MRHLQQIYVYRGEVYGHFFTAYDSNTIKISYIKHGKEILDGITTLLHISD